MKITRLFTAACVAVFAVMGVSCEEENISQSGDGIQFDVRTAGPMQTKSVVSIEKEDIELSIDGVKFTLTVTAAPILDEPFGTYETRATAVNSANEFSSFKMNIQSVASGVDVQRGTNGDWAIKRENGQYYRWPDSIPAGGLCFDSMYGEGASYSGNTVFYTMTDSDLLIGRTFATQNAVPVTLYHPLASLRFKLKNFVDGFSVTGIKLSGMHTSGSFTLPASGEVDEAADLSAFVWTMSGFTSAVSADFYDAESGDEFFIIPQTTAGVQMTITFQQDGGPEKTITVDMPDAGLVNGKWQAGYYYTYTISGGGYVEIEAYDKMDGVANSNEGEVKTEVKALNTGSLPVCVRAFVVTNWYNDADKIVAPYTGEIGFNETDWYRPATDSNNDGIDDGDGFWYHKAVVDPDSSTAELIHSFTPDLSTAPTITGFNLHAEMRVVFQAVEADKVSTVWPEFPNN